MQQPSTNVREIVAVALAIKGESDRRTFIADACAADPDLRKKVEALLSARSNMEASLPAQPNPEVPGTGRPNANAITQDTLPGVRKNPCAYLTPSVKPDSMGRLGHYEILGVLGKGGFGTVFKAFDEKLHRLVAVKMLAPELSTCDESRQRFLREARVTASIRHENVVYIHAVEEHPVPYLVMEYIAGMSLQRKLEQTGPFPVKELLRVGHQIARGLAAAHQQGLIHRDIKPDNILLENGSNRVKITDFGLARAVKDGSLTQVGIVAGTPLYMAPEQALGQPLDHRADLFSLGSTLYVLAAGRPAFCAAATLAIMIRVVDSVPQPLSGINSAIPSWLADCITKLLAKRPDDRYQSAQEVADLFERKLAEPDSPDVVVSRQAAPVPQVVADTYRAPGMALAKKPGRNHDTDPQPRPLWNQADLPSHRSRRSLGLWLGLILGVLLLGAGAYALRELVGGTPGGGTNGQPHSPPNVPVVVDALPPRFTNSLGMQFTLVPKGKAWLGSGSKAGTREVTITQDFYLGIYEVTQEEWEALMGKENNPSHFARSGKNRDAIKGILDAELKRFPVDSVSWDQCQEFVKRLNAKTKEDGWVYRLPTTVEWEYACRGGPLLNKADFDFDFYLEWPTNTLWKDKANFKATGLNRTCKVGSYPPNSLGLHDMHGNVFEYCDDIFAEGPDSLRLLRGGCWKDDAEDCQANHRNFGDAKSNYDGGGLRLARLVVGKVK